MTPGKPDDVVALIDDKTACVVVQNPDVFGLIRDLKPIAEAAHAKGALLIAVVTEAVSLGLLEAAGRAGCRHCGRAKASPSATGSISAVPMSGYSPPERNIFARCQVG